MSAAVPAIALGHAGMGGSPGFADPAADRLARAVHGSLG